LTAELELATDLARAAGGVTLRHFGGELEVQYKPGKEPVTVADRAAEALILEGLRAAYPADGLLAEESADHASWAGRRRAWVVDPLDGTKDFVAGRPGFSVMIGLLSDFEPVLGVIHQPTSGLTFQALRGGGAVMLREGQRLPLRVSDVADPRLARLVTSRSHRTPDVDRVRGALGTEDELSVGSVGLKIGLIARAERDLYVNPEGNCKLWDACAPQVVVTEAGGRMTDRRGDPIRYDPAAIRLQRGLVASNGACHEAVLQKLRLLFG
jgi:3'(2'), 5'-bisphosphate nucleotidase